MQVLREKTDIQTRLEEVEEDLNDVMKKYKAAVQQVRERRGDRRRVCDTWWTWTQVVL